MAPLPLSRKGREAQEVAQEAAREAGAIILARFPGEKSVRHKGWANLVTEADILAEKAILGRLQEAYPDFGLLSEESEAVLSSSPYTWVVDPLDGTNNFSFGVPFFAINVALVREGEKLLGLTYDPLRQEMFLALSGKGAWLNQNPISVSSRTRLQDALVSFDLGYDAGKGKETLEMARALRSQVFSFRILGSGALALAYVACGRLDMYLHRGLYPWDIAAGSLLVQEAGGIATEGQGRPLSLDSTEIVAANPALHAEFMRKTAHPENW